MTYGLKELVQDVFLWRDFTIDGERVITIKDYGETEQGKKYLKTKSHVIKDTGEVLDVAHYSPESRKPYACWIRRNYILA